MRPTRSFGTIFALSTVPGKSGLAVIRISGPGAKNGVEEFCGTIPKPRTAALRKLCGADGETLDQAIVIHFPEGGSYTGEDIVEFHLHGSQAVVRSALRTLASRPGFRMAEPGEFTLRALANGRMDLAEVEGLGDLIDAETEAQRRQALRVFEGNLGRKTEGWRTGLVRAMALLETPIDFADEEISEDVRLEALDLIKTVTSELNAEVRGSKVAERIRDGFEVAIVGPPNTGKSTLLNHLAGREAAITSEYAGTTRDVIEVRMDLEGLPVSVLDTAGLRKADDPVEEIGVERAKSRAAAADLRIFLTEGTVSPEIGLRPKQGDVLLRSKADLLPDTVSDAVSGKTGRGVPEMIRRVATELGSRAAVVATATNERHRSAMASAVSALDSAKFELTAEGGMEELAVEETRRAVQALDALIGHVHVEDVLDEIFASFCLGK